jgi:IgGFc binding protein
MFPLRRSGIVLAGFGFSLFTCFAAAACRGGGTGGSDEDGGPRGPDGSGYDSGPTSQCPRFGCSSDLRTVVDECDGVDSVFEVCGPDEACGAGRCVGPCEAAALSNQSIGCEFYAVPPEEPTYHGSCFAAFVANAWYSPVTVTGALGGKEIDLAASMYLVSNEGGEVRYTPLTGGIPPGETAVIFLANVSSASAQSCPAGVVPVVTEDPIESGTSRTRAFRLRTDVPVSAYSMFPYGGAKVQYPTATLLLPTSSWLRDYVAVSPERIDTPDHEELPGEGTVTTVGRRTLQIVAMEDDTEIQIRPVADIAGGTGVVGAAKNQVQRWTLNRGEVLQFAQDESLTGSPMQANRPIGVFGGAECSFVPSTWRSCDVMQQQILPLEHWGARHALVPHRPRVDDPAPFPARRERVPYTIVAAVEGTVLQYDPAPPDGAPRTMDAFQRATFFADDVLTVRSQDLNHPIFVGSYMTGADFDGGHLAPWAMGGDPDFVASVPVERFLDRYVFTTDHNYANTTLTIVRRKTENRFSDVYLDCSGGPLTEFRPLGSDGELEFAWVRLTTNFQPATGTCGYGRHEARSEGSFSLTVWGTDSYASYGYAAGTGLRERQPHTVP